MNKEFKLLLTHAVKEIVNIFSSIFLGIYFLKITEGNISKVIVYYIIYFLSHILFRYLVSKFLNKNNVIKIYRLALFTNLGIALILLFSKENIVNYINIFAVLFAFSQCLYWTSYEILIYNLNDDFKKYFTYDYIFMSITNIVFPVIFGTIISKYSYLVIFIILAFIALLSFILSFFIDKKFKGNVEKINLKEFIKNVKSKTLLKEINLQSFCDGMTTGGVLTLLTNLIIFSKIENEAVLGTISSVVAIISIFIALIAKKKVNSKNFAKVVLPISILIFLSTLPISIKPTLTLAIVYIFISEIGNVLTNIPGNELIMKNLNKVTTSDFQNAYLWCIELTLNLGRVTGLFSILIVWNIFKNVNTLYLLFILFSAFYIFRTLVILNLYKKEGE